MSRHNVYETASSDAVVEEESSREEMSVRLQRHVKNLNVRPLFTRDWLLVNKSARILADIALKQSRSASLSSKHQTLWEGDEMVVRMIFEDGRLNVVLRILNAASDELEKHVSATRNCAVHPADTAPLPPHTSKPPLLTPSPSLNADHGRV